MAKYKVTTSSGNLNLRQYDTTTSKIIASIPKGTIVDSYTPPTPNSKCASGWLYISYGGKYGYASADYLTLVSSSTTPTTTSTSASASSTSTKKTTTTTTTTKTTTPTTTSNSSATKSNSNTNNNIKTQEEMAVSTTMSEATKKKLKIAGIVAGVAIGGFLIYKAMKKKPSAQATKSLNGVRKRKSAKRKRISKKLLKLN